LDLVLGKAGSKVLLMGNEAIARGAIEAGVNVATGYPGTPSSEVLEVLIKVSRKRGFYAEWAVNERVALEIGFGASYAGLRSIVTMKAPGINVASDPLISAAYSEVKGGMVVLVADDPGPHTTQTEQDSRWYALLAKLPMIEPSMPQDTKDLTKLAFELSEHVKLPVILRTTTRVNHTVGDVILGRIKVLRRKPKFLKDVRKYVRASMEYNLKRHKWLLKRLKYTIKVAEKLKMNTMIQGSEKVGIITSGISYTYVSDVVKKLNKSPSILKLELINPIPEKLVLEFLTAHENIVVVEELDPYLEHHVRSIAHKANIKVRIVGKDMIPLTGELNPIIVEYVLRKVFNLPSIFVSYKNRGKTLPSRPPQLCPGCPHRASYYLLKRALVEEGFKLDEVPIVGDIGCYALSFNPPLEAIWIEHSMGASISIAIGLKLAGVKGPIIATIGDSTFYHAGIPALIEAVHKRVDVLVLILDNGTVAMTGHQVTPASNITESGRYVKPVVIEKCSERYWCRIR